MEGKEDRDREDSEILWIWASLTFDIAQAQFATISELYPEVRA